MSCLVPPNTNQIKNPYLTRKIIHSSYVDSDTQAKEGRNKALNKLREKKTEKGEQEKEKRREREKLFKHKGASKKTSALIFQK